eukprot:TRINITY_DN3501_c1_g1_i1.p1 TRINITY_DN3501_c1_g1~~TRINITY_DN3501_c1_g1_i1.p1  ORF type:complete len:404 (+),score=106.15 TRINITY_DN3501_c1_g1_i1:153-1214(+)
MAVLMSLSGAVDLTSVVALIIHLVVNAVIGLVLVLPCVALSTYAVTFLMLRWRRPRRASEQAIEAAGGLAVRHEDGRVTEVFCALPAEETDEHTPLIVCLPDVLWTGRLLPLSKSVQEWAREHARQVISMSLPSHGESDDHPDRRLSRYHEDVEDVMRALRLAHKPFHVIGFGAGGIHALHVLAAIPHRVCNLSLVGTYAPAPIASFFHAPYALAMRLVSNSYLRHGLGALVALNPAQTLQFAPDYKALSVAGEFFHLLPLDYKRSTSRSWHAYGSAMPFQYNTEDLALATAHEARPHQLHVYVLKKDTLIDHRNSLAVAKILPGARVHSLSCGHFEPLEQIHALFDTLVEAE